MNFKVALLLLGCCAAALGESRPVDAAWKKLHEQAVNRQRRIIFNNDGNEPVKDCKTTSKEELLGYRTSPLAGSQVDSIFYCTWSSGFGMFTHLTKVGQVFTSREGRFTNNCMPEFVRQGVDPLQVMVEFAHQQKMELFWSFRVNDTHDGSATDYGPVMFRTNTLKQAHPEWLIGSKAKRPKYGAWSAVDFGVPEIRDLAFRYCEEVCQNYDVDGIELDFLRHSFFFKRSGKGEPCSETELNQMTSLIRRIRAMTEELGRKRKRPILVAIRVPDSEEYCKLIGLDLRTWLKEHLTDLLVVGGYTQLNPWEYSVRLGHEYGVKVYPSLDESRVKDETAKELRSSVPTYHGRAMNVWAAGADGVYLFNFSNPHSPLWRELGDPKTLRALERNYFASVRGVGSMPIPHQKYLHVPTLNPGSPILITAEKTGQIQFQIGEDFSNDSRKPADLKLRLRFKTVPVLRQLTSTVNGVKLSKPVAHDDWLEYHLTGKQLRKDSNTLVLANGTAKPITLLDLYVAVGKQ